jgi:hypothetical protein
VPALLYDNVNMYSLSGRPFARPLGGQAVLQRLKRRRWPSSALGSTREAVEQYHEVSQEIARLSEKLQVGCPLVATLPRTAMAALAQLHLPQQQNACWHILMRHTTWLLPRGTKVRQVGRQAGRQAGGRAGGWTDGQTDRRTGGQK